MEEEKSKETEASIDPEASQEPIEAQAPKEEKFHCKNDDCINAKRALMVFVSAVEKVLISPQYIKVFSDYQKENPPYDGPNFVKELSWAQQLARTFDKADFNVKEESDDKKDPIT